MQTKEIAFTNNNYSATQNIQIEIPSLCPICEVSNNPVNTLLSVQSYEGNSNVATFHHRCTGCNKPFFTLQFIESKRGILITHYPETRSRKFDELVLRMSPRFVELYNQAETAERFNHTDLSGMGYRASLEVLIKDYALHFELDSKEEIAKLNLNNAIGKYFRGDESIISADVVRKLGNDYAHWDKEYSELPLEILKRYLEIFIKQIEVKLMLKYPPVTTRLPN